MPKSPAPATSIAMSDGRLITQPMCPDQRLGSAQGRGHCYFTTRLTARPGTTITLATVLPAVRD